MNDFKSDATYKIIEESICDLSFLSKLKPIPKKVHMSGGIKNLFIVKTLWF